jgi:orotidine-5'-phosphate decarboxylase
VTVLTSLDPEAIAQIGWPGSVSETAERLGQLAVRAGADGLVCSPGEAKRLRELLGPDVYLCTPGIRPSGAATQDQARAQTPKFASEAGSNLLVVGRPLSTAADPVSVAKAIEAELAS